MKIGIASGSIHDLHRLMHRKSRETQLRALKKEMFELYMDIEKALQDWHPLESSNKKSSNQIIA